MIIRNSDNVVLYGKGWELSDKGAYNVKRDTIDRKTNLSNSTYLDINEPVDFQGGHFTYDGGYHLTATGLIAAKANKKAQLDLVFIKEAFRPIVDTGLGFEVNGGYQDLADFTVGEDLGITTIRAVDNSMNDVTDVQFQSVILAIKMKGLMLKQNKWALADSITAATTEAELDAININEGW